MLGLSYRCNRRAGVFSGMRMCDICTKNNGGPVTNQRYPPRNSIHKNCVPATNLYKEKVLCQQLQKILVKGTRKINSSHAGTHLYIYLKCDVCEILLAHLKYMFSQTAL